jgi:hypothetical protein
MATIKLQPSGAVVLKDGKVSCTCCDTECCLYPASQLGVGYVAEDLPNGVTLNFDGNLFPVVRSGSIYFDIEGYSTYILDRDGSTWRVTVTTIIPNEPPDVVTLHSVGQCLIGNYSYDIMPEFLISVLSQYAQFYTVSGPISGIVERESDCVWRGAGLTLTNFSYQWKVNGKNKLGFQNTPVGSYEGGYSVS